MCIRDRSWYSSSSSSPSSSLCSLHGLSFSETHLLLCFLISMFPLLSYFKTPLVVCSYMLLTVCENLLSLSFCLISSVSLDSHIRRSDFYVAQCVCDHAPSNIKISTYVFNLGFDNYITSLDKPRC